MALLEIRDLNVRFATTDGEVSAVNGISLDVARGQTLGIVGESGSGKSQLAFSIMGLLARSGRAAGTVRFDGTELLNAAKAAPHHARHLAIVISGSDDQPEPLYAGVGPDGRVLTLHKGMDKAQAVARSARMLDAVRIPDAKARIRLYRTSFPAACGSG